MMRTPNSRARIKLLAAWAAVLAVLAAVFASYLQPARVVELANLMWSCF